MKTIVIKAQSEFDALPARFDEYTVIEIRAAMRIVVTQARGNSSVEARDNSRVVAWDNSSVEARGNSRVVAWDNSSVEARGNSSVVAWDNSRVVAWDNSRVVAWGNSRVVAWGNSSVVAWDNAGIHVYSSVANIELFGFAVAWLLVKAKAKAHGNAKIIKPKRSSGLRGWLGDEGVKSLRGCVTLFKRVSKEFKTQEGTDHETQWVIGATLTHPAWNPKKGECGGGKFHACSRPYFADQFRSVAGDRYVAVKIAVKDLYAWPKGEYPHKIAFRKGTVLYECDKMGRKIGQ